MHLSLASLARSGGRILVLLGAAGLAASRAAEATWLQPEAFSVTPGAMLWVNVQHGAEFGEAAGAPARDAVASVAAWLGGEPAPVGSIAAFDKGVRFLVTLPRPGVAVLAAGLKPALRTLQPAEVERYFRAVHATDEIRAAWAGLGASSWREFVRPSLKTFVCVGMPGGTAQPWTARVRQGFEIVPDQDPAALKAGAPFAVRVYRGTQPVAGCVVSFLSTGENREHVVVTDERGRAAARLDLPGAWLVQSADIRRVKAATYDWETDDAAMTVFAQ